VATTQLFTGAASSGSKNRLAQTIASSLASLNTASKDLANAATVAAANTTDATTKTALQSIASAAANNATELTLADSSSIVAQALAGTGTISTAVSNMSTAITNAQPYVSGLSSVTTPAPTSCRGKYAQLTNGDVQITATFPAAQSYVEVFVQVNGGQVAAGDVSGSKVTNADGTFSYTRVVPASYFHNGDAVTYRFYSYITGQAGVFTPGPAELVWFPSVTYSTTSFPTACNN
jgi:hypothetical protein